MLRSSNVGPKHHITARAYAIQAHIHLRNNDLAKVDQAIQRSGPNIRGNEDLSYLFFLSAKNHAAKGQHGAAIQQVCSLPLSPWSFLFA